MAPVLTLVMFKDPKRAQGPGVVLEPPEQVLTPAPIGPLKITNVKLVPYYDSGVQIVQKTCDCFYGTNRIFLKL